MIRALRGVFALCALLGGAVVYFAFSVLGLEIIALAEETGVLDEI